MNKQTLQDLNLSNNYLFCQVMADENVCRMVLEKILSFKIGKIVQLESEKTVNPLLDRKGVRFDIYAKDDDNRVYRVEMQTGDEKNIPRRARYYQSVMDVDNLFRGDKYEALLAGFVIFICTWDPYKKGLYQYTFRNLCIEEKELEFGDDTVKIVLNTKGTVDNVDSDIKAFLKYIEDSTDTTSDESDSELVHEIHKKVLSVKSNPIKEVEYMTLEEMLEEREAVGFKQGVESGKEQKALETAINFKNAGVSEEIISQCTGLPIETIQAL